MTSKDILETEIPTLLKSKPELAKEINAIIHFNITGDQGGTWTMDLTKDSDWVKTGIQGESKMTITVPMTDQQAAEQDKVKGTENA